MLIRVMCLLFSAFIVMGCAGSSVADGPDAPTTSHGGATSSQLEPVDSTTPPADNDSLGTTVAPEKPVTVTTQAANTGPSTTASTSSSVPSATTAPPPTTTKLRDFLTEEPNGTGLFLGTVEPDA